MAQLAQESDGSGSSRRFAALVYPSFLYAGALTCLILSVLLNVGMWAIIGGLGLLAGGIVLQLWLFNLINATNVLELTQTVLKKGPNA